MIKTKFSQKINIQSLFFVLSSIFLFFGIRKYFILFFPFFIIFGYKVFHIKVTIRQIQFVLLLLVVSFLSFLISGGFIINYITSIVIYLSFFLFLTSPIDKKYVLTKKIDFFKISSRVLFIVNIIAFLFLVKAVLANQGIKSVEDSFSGVYGKSGLAQHALSIINFMYAAFYLSKKKYYAFLFFIIAGIFGFYGLGFLLLIITVITIILIHIKVTYKYILYLLVIGFALISLIVIVNPRNYNYIKDNVQKTVDGMVELNYEKEIALARKSKWSKTPRKLTFYRGALLRLKKNPEILLLGTSPGTYNSKTAFLLNGDYSNIGFLKENVKNRHKYHVEDVFPLWNIKIYGRAWMDGTRNQPFSSLFAVLMEYGFFIGLIFIFWILKKIKYIYSNLDNMNTKLFILFVSIYYGLTTLFLNIIETVDLIFIFLLIIKTLEVNSAYKYKDA